MRPGSASENQRKVVSDQCELVSVFERSRSVRLQEGRATRQERRRGSCPVGRVPAGEIEAAVVDQLRAVFRQPEIVAGPWKAARAHADDISEADARAALQQLDPLWDELFPAEQARIVALLVQRVDIGTEGLNVFLRVDGLGGLARAMLAGGIGQAA